MEDPKAFKVGDQLLSEKVYFLDKDGVPIRPVYQKDTETGIHSYRVYTNGGNTKDKDKDIHCYKELAKYLIDGYSVRCKVRSGKSSNRLLGSRDVAKLVIEVENA